jgi:hypothetical protein
MTMRFDADGRLIDQKAVSGYFQDRGLKAMTQRADGGFAAAVATQNYNYDATFRLLRFDQLGNFENVETVILNYFYVKPMALARFGPNKYALSVSMSSDSGAHAVILLDSNLHPLWSSVSADQPYYRQIGKSSQGRILLAGDESAASGGYGFYGLANIHVMLYDSLGGFYRSASYGGQGNESLREAMPISNGKTVLLGETESYGKGGTDLYVIFYQE